VELIRRAAGHFWEAQVDTTAGKDGSERSGNRWFSWLATQRPLASCVWTALSRASSMLHFLYDYSRPAGMSQQQPDSHSDFIAASRHLVLLTVKTQGREEII